MSEKKDTGFKEFISFKLLFLIKRFAEKQEYFSNLQLQSTKIMIATKLHNNTNHTSAMSQPGLFLTICFQVSSVTSLVVSQERA